MKTASVENCGQTDRFPSLPTLTLTYDLTFNPQWAMGPSHEECIYINEGQMFV